MSKSKPPSSWITGLSPSHGFLEMLPMTLVMCFLMNTRTLIYNTTTYM